MPVPSAITDLSTTAALNSPGGSESAGTIDDYLRQHAAFIRALYDQDGTDRTALAASTGSSLVGQVQTGTGALTRTVQSELRDVLKASQFATPGTGTDSASGLQAAITAAQAQGKPLLIDALFRTETPLVISANNVALIGMGRSTGIVTNSDIDIIRVDIGGAYRYFEQIENMQLGYTGAGTPTTGACIRYFDSLGTLLGGASHGKFRGLWMDHAYGIVFDRCKAGTFAPAWPDVLDYGQMEFSDNRIAYNAGRTKVGIWFKGGPGAHNFYRGNIFQCAEACVRMGGSDDGVGDQTFGGDNHFLDAQYGIDIIGPTTGGKYNQNVTICGNQFDGITVATVRMSNMQNFRIVPNNSTASVGLSLTACTNYIAEDRNSTTTQALTVTSRLYTDGAILTDANGTRVGQYMAMRRTNNTDYIKVVGGNADGAGASVSLYGGAHATLPSHGFIDADRFRIRSQNTATTYFDVQSSGVTVGNGAWNGQPVLMGAYRLWVDASGRLRIKNGAPTSDTDGTIVGVQA